MENLGRLLEAQLGRDGSKLALTDGKTSYSFSEMEARAEAIASRWVEEGLSPGNRVMVLAAKDILVPILALAAWKAGAIFVPVDPDQPIARLRFISESTEPSLLAVPDKHPFDPGNRILRFSEIPSSAPDRRANLPVCGADSPALIIFTSGSTGTPKGALLTHGNFLAFFGGQRSLISLEPDSRVINFAPFYFDVCFIDTYLPLAVGASVHLTKGLPIPSKHLKLIRDFRATHLMAIATVLNILSDQTPDLRGAGLDSLKAIITGAEVPDKSVLVRWMEAYPSVRVHNLYGPTECACAQMTHRIEDPDGDRDGVMPIGTAHGTVTVRLESADGTVIESAETPGEILIGGPQVMAGYWRDEAATAAAIVVRQGLRYYRTGDYALRDAEGIYHFLGRRDDEVKINGRRINLLEVRKGLETVDGFRSPSVSAMSKDGNKYIVALLKEEPGFVPGDLPSKVAHARASMKGSLPEYMIPSYLIIFQEFETSATGKTDFRPILRKLMEAYVPGKHKDFRYSNGSLLPLEPAEAKGA